jgi:WD40 repeat protein
VTTGPRIDARLAARWPTAAPARQAIFSRDGRLAAFSDASGTIIVRDTRNWSIVRKLRHPDGAASLAFTKGGSALLSGGYDGAIRFWDLRTGEQTGAIKADSRTVWTMDISPDGSRVAAAGEDAVIRVWELKTPINPIELRGHSRNIWEVRFSPDGHWLVTSGEDNRFRLWRLQPKG